MRPEAETVAGLIEAVLAVAGEPVPGHALLAAAGEGADNELVEEALELLRGRHGRPESGLVIEQVSGGWRLATRPEYEAAVRAYLGIRSRARLSHAALETLAIIAYRQPMTLPEISYLRGVNSAAVVRTLLDRRLVRVAGRKQVVGTPLLYRTTKEFLAVFGLSSLAELPSTEEVAREVGDLDSGD